MEKQTLYHGSNVIVEHNLCQLGYHKPNYQICILAQEIVDKYLQFKSNERV